MRKLVVALLAVFVGAGSLRAQGEVDGPLLLTLPASTRALALGGVYVPVGADADALFYNPALLVAARGMGVAVQRWGSEGTLGQVTAAMEMAPGGLGVGVRYLSHLVPASALVLEDSETDLFRGSGAAASGLEAAVGYARPIGGVRIGVAGRYVEQQEQEARAGALTVDVGASLRVGPATVDLAVQNLGGRLELPFGTYELPRRVTLRAAHPSMVVGPFDLITTGAVSVTRAGGVVPAAGVELAYWPVVGKTFVGRLGVRRPQDGAGPVTLGGAFIGDRFTVEYAYGRFDTGAGTHRLGVRWLER